ncbi:MAG: glycine/sarcosine/betaine reductase selenoprotein B family protein [Candidatus Entotheonellia bacterium]
MNLEILEEYIKQEWAPDFAYAHYETTPWTPFRKATDAACVALVTTGGVHLRQDPPFAGIDDASYRQIPGTAPVTSLTVSHPFFDTGELEQDIDALFPLTRLRELQHAGVIRRVAAQHFSFMGVIPHWQRLEGSAKEVAEQLGTAGVDAVILTPGSPICNHSLAVIQRVLEGAGLATISLTIEPDIMKLVRVPRAMVVDFPPGCPVGEPTDREKQRKVLKEALEYLTTMTQPGTIWKSPFKWTRSCSTPVCKL